MILETLFGNIAKLSRTTTTLLMLCVSGLLSTAMATGDGSKSNPYVFTNGGAYQTTAGVDFYATFTAPSDGILTITEIDFLVYDNADFTGTEHEMDWNGNYANKEYSYNCTGGETYYLMARPIETKSFIVRFGGTTALILNNVIPAANTVFSSSNGLVSLEFNKSVKISTTTLKAGSSENTLSANISGAYVSIDFKELLNNLYANGSVKEGDDITISMTGVRDASNETNMYGNNGELEIKYIAGSKPMQLISSTNTPDGIPANGTFYSWFMPSDEKGLATFTFDKAVNFTGSMSPKAMLIFGNPEIDGGYYEETLNVSKVDDNTIGVDFRGKLRRHKDIINIDTVYTYITLKLSNVHDLEGNYAYFQGTGSTATCYIDYSFEEVSYSATPDWSAIGGSSLSIIDNSTKNIELWLRETGGNATFDGAEFSYTDNETVKVATVAKENISIEDDPDDREAHIITIPLPVKNTDPDTQITVSLTNVERPDGITTSIQDDAMKYYTHTFSTTGITDSINAIVSSREKEGNIYGLDGKLVMKNGNPKDLNGISKGVYIINGKKIVY